MCKLKTGIQWRFLPIKQLFSGYIPSYKTIFGHYRKWCKEEGWRTCWIAILKKNKSKLNLSSCDFDDELYKECYSIERSNAWMDSFRSVLNRFDAILSSWLGVNYLDIIALGLRKFKQMKKSR